jgi:hypothetical protein
VFSARTLAVAVAALVCLAPLADARSQPALYFLKDAKVTDDRRAPVGDGVLSTQPPPPIDLNNPANNTPPSVRLIFPYTDALLPTQFVANSSQNTGRLFGVIAAYLFLPKSPALQSATLNVSLYALPKDPEVPPPLGGGGDLIAWARLPLNYENSTLPNATSFVPQNVTDPQGAVNYTAAQLVAYGLTTVYSSGALVYLDDAVQDYFVDRTIDSEARLALRLVLENGTAVGPLPPQQVPIGAGQTIVYDFGLAFSLVLIPWFEQDPPQPPPPPPPPRTTTTSPTTQPTPTTTTTKASIALPFGILVALALGAAWTARRRES